MGHLKLILKPALILLSLFSFVYASVAQPTYTIRIVDNNFNAPTGPTIYPTMQEAVDAANPGDIIYIQPSPTKYGDVYVDKTLHFKGIGFNLDKDQPHISDINDIIFRNNIDNTSNPSFSTVQGLSIDNIYFANRDGSTTYTLTDVNVFNCDIYSIYWYSVTRAVRIENMQIANCTFTSSITFPREVSNLLLRNNLLEDVSFNSTNPQTAVITNNIIYGQIDKNSEGDNLIIKNNNFVGSKGNTDAFGEMVDAIIANNIFYGRTPSISAGGGSTSTNFQRNIFTNNLSYETGNDQLPPTGGGVGNSGDGNIMGSSPLFVNVLLLNNWSADYDFTLQPGSPAIEAGSDGTDIGISGGAYSFLDANISLRTTSLPTIQIFNTSTVINPGDLLDIRVKAKTN